MWFGRIGGGFLFGSLLTIAIAALMGRTGAQAATGGIAEIGVSGVILEACLAGIALGVSMLSVCSSRPLDDRTLKIGLRTLAVGLVIGSGVLYELDVQALTGSSADALLIPLVGGALATMIGALVTAIALTRIPGSPRAVGSLLLGGLLLVLIGNWMRNGNPPSPTAVALSAAGIAILGLGGLALGLLALAGPSSGTGERPGRADLWNGISATLWIGMAAVCIAVFVFMPREAAGREPSVTISLGTGGSGCGLASKATTFTIGQPIRLVATFSRALPAAETVTIGLRKNYKFDVDGYPGVRTLDNASACIDETLPQLAPGHYTAVITIGAGFGDGGQFDVIP